MIGTPGQVAGLYALWKRFGQLQWSQLVLPAEQIARNGFTVSLSMEMAIKKAIDLVKQQLHTVDFMLVHTKSCFLCVLFN